MSFFGPLCRPFRRIGFFCICLAVAVSAGCSDEDQADEKTRTQDCGPNQRWNPNLGCVSDSPPDRSSSDDIEESHQDVDSVETNDTSDSTDTDNTQSDGGECAEGVDDDGDGLSNACECELNTNPRQADTDSDGLPDGEEDANQNCQLDPGETDPREPDTDNDGLTDGEEANDDVTDPLNPDTDGDGIEDGIEVQNSCLDAGDSDTDGDGLPDGMEDSDGDGELGSCCQIGECSEDDYSSSCAEGQSNPCKEDTDGDGTPDSDEVRYRECQQSDLDDLSTPEMISSTAGDYQLTVESTVTHAEINSSSGSVNAHVFEDTSHSYTGFILAYQPGSSIDGPSELGNKIVGQVQNVYSSATRRSSGRKISTYDGEEAVVGAITDLPSGPALGEARDQLLATLTGTSSSNIQHTLSTDLSGGSGGDNPTLFVHEIVKRQNQAVVVGAFVTLNQYKDQSAQTGIRVDDLTGGGSLAKAGTALQKECVSYEVDKEPKVDILIAMDASGSMSDEQQRLSNFSSTFTNLLNEANVDWRIGVTSVACQGIKEDDGISSEFASLWPAPSGGGLIPTGDIPPCYNPASGMFPGGIAVPETTNGKLMAGNFTSDPSEVGNRIANVPQSGVEHSMTMAAAAADRALPRRADNPSKIRPGASVVLISVTDEGDQFFSGTLDFLPTSQINLNQSQQDKLNSEVTPWVNYLLKPELGATAFGLYWPPGEQCGSADTVGHGIARIVRETGGNGGSVCQADIANTLREIADATAGIASGLRLRGTPSPQTINVKHVDRSAGRVSQMSRSRQDGFDYDPIVNRISFTGDNPPATDDKVIIPYLRWENSVIECSKDSDCPQEQKLKCVSGECR